MKGFHRTPFAPSLGEGYVPPRTWVSIEIQVRSPAQRELAKLVARARKAGVRATSLLGSVAVRVVGSAPCPVLTVWARRR